VGRLMSGWAADETNTRRFPMTERTMMSTTLEREETTDQTIEHFDVVIVGAGISGIGTAYHLQNQNPGRSFVMLEAQDQFGGTWHTHRYPGIRSDSDLYTFGYLQALDQCPIATAAEIQKYLSDVIAENDLQRHIRYGHRIDSASWSSEDNRWSVNATRTETGETVTFVPSFLWMCQGYYRHAEGYTPQWPGMESSMVRSSTPKPGPTTSTTATKR